MKDFVTQTALLLPLLININLYAQSGSTSGFTDATTGNPVPQLLAVTVENTGPWWNYWGQYI
jgi:hypothetical protein